ncbi:MAG: hypothetical protein JSR45_03260 [Proteobacteria bacterium]|nr:hypothetical protein [Pseudomonadota bacterium]
MSEQSAPVSRGARRARLKPVEADPSAKASDSKNNPAEKLFVPEPLPGWVEPEVAGKGSASRPRTLQEAQAEARAAGFTPSDWIGERAEARKHLSTLGVWVGAGLFVLLLIYFLGGRA